MSRLEYLTAFISIILGLGLADLMQSTYQLFQARRRVRFHWLALAWAFLVFLAVVLFFWNFYTLGQREVWRNFFAFVFLLVGPALLFLVSANALPDEVPKNGDLDLEQFYFERPRGFFILLALNIAHGLATVRLSGISVPRGARSILVLLFALFGLLAWRRDRWLHVVATCAIFLLIGAFVFLYALQLD